VDAQRKKVQMGRQDAAVEQPAYIAHQAEAIFEPAQSAGNLSVALKALGEFRKSASSPVLQPVNCLMATGRKSTCRSMVGDKLREIRAYLLACHLPDDLTDHIMGFITVAQSGTMLGGQATS
jgi:hypothetical protein